MNRKTLQFERGIEINLVQTQQRKQGREGARDTAAVSLKIAREHLGGKATCPFIKVAQYKAGAMKFRIVQDLWAHQLSSLLAAFKETRTQVQIKNMQGRLELNVSAQTATSLASWSGNVVVVDGKQGKAAEQEVTVSAAIVTTVFTETSMEAEFPSDELRLVFLGRARNAQNFLQCYDVRVDFAQDLHNACRSHAAIESSALVYVVGQDSKTV